MIHTYDLNNPTYTPPKTISAGDLLIFRMPTTNTGKYMLEITKDGCQHNGCLCFPTTYPDRLELTVPEYMISHAESIGVKLIHLSPEGTTPILSTKFLCNSPKTKKVDVFLSRSFHLSQPNDEIPDEPITLMIYADLLNAECIRAIVGYRGSHAELRPRLSGRGLAVRLSADMVTSNEPITMQLIIRRADGSIAVQSNVITLRGRR